MAYRSYRPIPPSKVYQTPIIILSPAYHEDLRVFFCQQIARKLYGFLRSTDYGLRSHPDGCLLSVVYCLLTFICQLISGLQYFGIKLQQVRPHGPTCCVSFSLNPRDARDARNLLGASFFVRPRCY